MHIAIIMDGNGRWAERRGLPRSAGHRAGARAVQSAVEYAARESVDVLTLYAFSSDNWSRPAEETGHLMRLFKHYLHREAARCLDTGVRVEVIGRRDRLACDLVRAVERIEKLTRRGGRLRLRLAVDYSSRWMLEQAARSASANAHEPEEFRAQLARAMGSDTDASDVDLLIRTGGEKRLSDFLLWECAYAELVFLDVHWPDFNETEFAGALEAFRQRHRRYGALPVACRATDTRIATEACSASEACGAMDASVASKGCDAVEAGRSL